MQLPAIDQNICGAWTQLEREFYNKMPFFFLKGESDRRKRWPIYQKLLGSVPWKPNQGPTMRRIGSEPSPVIRQSAYPQRIYTERVTADVFATRERIMDAYIYEHKFVSTNFNFVPEFTDFMKHTNAAIEDINRQIITYEDIFYRTMLLDKAPRIYIAGIGLVDAPTAIGNAAGTQADSKTLAWWAAQIATLLGATDGSLTITELFKALNCLENDIGASPFDGSGTQRMDSMPLDGRYLLVIDGQAYNQFIGDPWTTDNRPLNMNIITDNFKGDIFGRIRARIEPQSKRLGLVTTAGLTAAVEYAPETIQLDTARDNYGQTIPNPSYTNIGPGSVITTSSPYQLAFLFGKNVGDSIDVGPPPAEFVGRKSRKEFEGMQWNGKTYLTDNFLVNCVDANGTSTVETNSWGEYLRAQAAATFGVSLFNAQNCLPILFKRRVGIGNAST